jgi:hypothetical protein
MRYLPFFMLLALSSCTASRSTLDERIIGRWDMERIVEDQTNDVTAEHDPSDNRYMQFFEGGTFESDGDPHGKNTGRWLIDAETAVLFIDSDAGEDDDSYWIVSIPGDSMHWQGTHFEFNSRFALDFQRASPR